MDGDEDDDEYDDEDGDEDDDEDDEKDDEYDDEFALSRRTLTDLFPYSMDSDCAFSTCSRDSCTRRLIGWVLEMTD